MKLAFFGTPAFAATILRALAADGRHEIAAVITQPDRPNRRGNKTEPPEVKKAAAELSLPVFQFQKLRAEGVETLRSFEADVFVTAAYGQILSAEILNLPKCGVWNVHASLLPKYRGSSPVQRAILNGESTLGVTIMKTALAVDAGDMVLQKSLTLDGDENTEEALSKLAPIGASALLEALESIENGSVSYQKQDETKATYYPMLKKEEGKCDFSLSARAFVDFVRAMNPWPSAFCAAPAGGLKLLRTSVADEISVGECGKIVAADTKYGIVVQVGHGSVRLEEVQPEGGKRMSAGAYLNGRKLSAGDFLS